MATEIDICNLALAHCGSKAAISSLNPPEGSEYAEACARQYPIALGCLLSEFPWSFATRRAALAKISDSMLEKGNWKYAYGLPADFLRVVDLKPKEGDLLPKPPHWLQRFPAPHGQLSNHEEYELIGGDAGPILLANIESPILRYITNAPKPTSFSPSFVLALSWILAAFISGDTVRGETGINIASYMGKQYVAALSRAKTLDAPHTKLNRGHMPRWIAER